MAPPLVLAVIASLPDDSATAAHMRGEAGGNGWGVDRHLQALTYDAINQLMIATGNWKKGKAPKFTPFPRPGAEGKSKAKKPMSLGEFAALHPQS